MFNEANTAEQLASKTWAGVSAWVHRSVNAHWFAITTGKGAMRMVHVEHPDTWRVDAQTSREENSESFAGLHAASSTPWYLFDEASAIPAKIWEVAEGGKTDANSLVYGYRRLKVLKDADATGNNVFRMTALPTHPESQFRFPPQQFQPRAPVPHST